MTSQKILIESHSNNIQITSEIFPKKKTVSKNLETLFSGLSALLLDQDMVKLHVPDDNLGFSPVTRNQHLVRKL